MSPAVGHGGPGPASVLHGSGCHGQARSAGLPVSLLLLALAPSGCTTRTSVTTLPRRAATPGPPPASMPLEAPAATSSLYAGVIPLGDVPYDNRSLPLVSPDGQYVAVQRGDAPDWQALLATPEASMPATTGVQVFRIDRKAGAAVPLFGLTEPLLLGRSGDARGFLVESPRSDGSRWIGRVPWGGGRAEWVVTGDEVNAFAGAGPGGALAWSRRPPGADRFDLVVQAAGGEWVLGAQGGDWMLPAWSATGAGFYVLRLDDQGLAIVFMDLAGGAAPRTRARLPLLAEARPYDAWQAMAGGALTEGAPRHGGEHLLFWHPGANRMALWRPVASPGAANLLEPRSMAAVIDRSGLLLVAAPEHLLAVRPDNPDDKRVLLPGPCVPRAVALEAWPYLLLQPGDGLVTLTAFRPLVEEPVTRASTSSPRERAPR